MQCPKCSAEVAEGSSFCPACGSPTDATTARERAADQPQARTKSGLLTMAAGVIVIAIVALILALAVARKPGQQVVRTEVPPVKPGPPVTQAPVNPMTPGPAVTQAKTPPPMQLPKKPPAPPEVVDYLKFVRAVEERRVAMRDAQAEYLLKKYVSGGLSKILTDMIGQLASPEEPTPQTDQPMEDLKTVAAAWENLLRAFDSRESPPQCRDLAGTYRTALGQYCNAMAKLFAAAARGDIGAVSQLSSQQDEIDKNLIAANEELGKVCDEYGIKREFNITPDKGGGTLVSP